MTLAYDPNIAGPESVALNTTESERRNYAHEQAEARAALPAKRAAYDAAIIELRNQQATLAATMENITAARERLNRLQLLANAADADVIAVKAEWDAAFSATDGVMSPELKKLRSTLRDARDLAEDYARILGESGSSAEFAELPAMEAARDMDNARTTALRLLAEIELQTAIDDAAPQLARAFKLFALSQLSDDPLERNVTLQLDPLEVAMQRLKHAALAVDPQTCGIPQDIATPANIAPLQWRDVRSVVGMTKRRKEAQQRAAA